MEEMQNTLLAVGPSGFEGKLSIDALFESPPRAHMRPRSAAPAGHELEQVESFGSVHVGDRTQGKKRGVITHVKCAPSYGVRCTSQLGSRRIFAGRVSMYTVAASSTSVSMPVNKIQSTQ